VVVTKYAAEGFSPVKWTDQKMDGAATTATTEINAWRVDDLR
jgi:hypothetical protein